MSMKEEKCILIVDDRSQSAVIKGIKARLQGEFVLDFIDIKTDSAKLKKDNGEDLDVEKLKVEIESRIKRKHVDIALTDFDLACEYFTGLDVVHMVHDIRKRLSFFIYSGDWSEVIKAVVGKDYSTAPIEDLVSGINRLIQAKIINCVGREDYPKTLIDYLQRDTDSLAEHRLCVLLRAHGEMRFESCFPEFKGMTFDEIADMIESHSDARSDEWIDAVLTQTIAYLVKVNKDE